MTSDSPIAIYRRNRRRAIRFAIDGDGQCAGGRRGIRVFDGVCEDLGQRLQVNERIHIRVAVVEQIRVAAIRCDRQRTVFANDLGSHCHRRGGAASGRCHNVCYRHVRHGVVRITVSSAIGLDVACGGRARVFRHRVDIGRGDRWVVGAIDGDGQGGEVGGLVHPLAIIDGVAEHFG